MEQRRHARSCFERAADGIAGFTTSPSMVVNLRSRIRSRGYFWFKFALCQLSQVPPASDGG